MAEQLEIQETDPGSPGDRCGKRVAVRELLGSEQQACDAFFGQLHWSDVRWRFGGPRTSGDCLLPRHDRAGRSLAFAACRKADDILGVINVEYIGVGTAEVGLIVRSDLKSRGVGSLLLSHVMEWSRTSGLKRLIGHIMIDNKAMLRLAYAAGFRCVGGNETLVEMIWPAPSAA